MPRRKSGPTRKAAVLGPHPSYYDPEQIRQREEIAAISLRDAEWKCEGFADMVLKKGFKAYYTDNKGVSRSWQRIGRDLFGEEMFNRHLKLAVERRAAQRASMQGRSSESSSG